MNAEELDFNQIYKKLDKKLDESISAAQIAQDTANQLKEQKAETDTTVQAAAEASANALQIAQDCKVKLQAVEKTGEFIEKSIARLPGVKENETNELETKAKHEMIAYLRKKTPISTEVIQLTAEALTKNGFHGVTPQRLENETKDLIAGSNPDGGYWIRPERSAMMIQRIFESSPVRTIANIETTSSDTFELIIDDDEAASGGWVGEVDDRPDTGTPKIGLFTIPIHEQFAQPKATQKMLDDAGFDIESWLSGKVTRKMTRVENTAFVVGDGSQKPRGFLSLPAWTVNSTPGTQGTYERGKLEQINSGINGDFDADTIKLVQNALIEDYQANAIWGTKRASWQRITTLKDGQGQYLLDPRSMKSGDTLVLLGKPVVFMNDIPEAATDSLSLVYGDFGVGYTIIDRIGFRVIRDNLTNKPNVKFYTTKRVGGDVTNYESIKIYKLAA